MPDPPRGAPSRPSTKAPTPAAKAPPAPSRRPTLATPDPAAVVPFLKPTKPPAEAKLELVEPAPTRTRPHGGHGVASRSLKRSSKAHRAAPRGAAPLADEPPLDGGRRRKDRGALVRRARGGGPPVGVLVAAPLVIVFVVAVALLTGGSPPPPPAATGTVAPAATPAPRAIEEERPPADDAPRPRPRGAATKGNDEEISPEEEALFLQRKREYDREQLEAERRLNEEGQARLGGAPAAPRSPSPAADDDAE
ncbi:MAG: hypothetical protein M9894_28775 [Planctomycetes bacterium]|nr:hypothetical protein [Planctomycetota bacterium]